MQGSKMPAYLIVAAAVPDRRAFLDSGYPAAAAALIGQFGGCYLLRAPGAELLEGDWGDDASVVISEWPDREAARRFWNSPDYAEVKRRRAGLAQCQVLLIDAPATDA
jgi:uncharacterized protein (DUF1330 family)